MIKQQFFNACNLLRALSMTEPRALHDIARQIGISISATDQLAMRLSRSGLVRGKRGRAGGTLLAVPLHKIRIMEIAIAIYGKPDPQAVYVARGEALLSDMPSTKRSD